MAMAEPTPTEIMNELRDIRRELTVMTNFVTTLQGVLSEMGSNPMLKAFGINGLEGLVAADMDMPVIPGMPLS
jgi:hypothetical protein